MVMDSALFDLFLAFWMIAWAVDNFLSAAWVVLPRLSILDITAFANWSSTEFAIFFNGETRKLFGAFTELTDFTGHGE